MLDSIQFDDAKTNEQTMRALEVYSENYRYGKIQKQCESDPNHPWGDGLNVLIMSDRCPGRAKGLYEYLAEKTKLSSVELCDCLADAKTCVQSMSVDILIFVGYQENDASYEIKGILEEKNPSVQTIKYAFLDDCIKRYCLKNGIQYAFSSSAPVREFIGYLDNSHSAHKIRLTRKAYCESPKKSDSKLEPETRSLWKRLKEKLSA